MYKALNNMVPEYISDIIPPFVRDQTSYPLRNRNDLTVPINRTEIFRESCIPSSTSLWNSLDNNFKEIPSFEGFKKQLKDIYLNATKVPSYYTYGNRILAIWHARLRNQCSSLNFDLYNNHVANDPSCECNEEIEDAVHFFFECQRYDIQRTVLFNATRNFHPLSINILLFGNPDLSAQDNQIIFDAVHSFV